MRLLWEREHACKQVCQSVFCAEAAFIFGGIVCSSAHIIIDRPSCRPTSNIIHHHASIMQSPQAPTRPPRPPRCSHVGAHVPWYSEHVRTYVLHVYVPGTCTYTCTYSYRAHQVRFDGHITGTIVRCKVQVYTCTYVHASKKCASPCPCSVGDSLCVGCGCLRFVGVVVFGMWCGPAM